MELNQIWLKAYLGGWKMMELTPRGAEGWGPETLYLLITNERTNLMMVG